MPNCNGDGRYRTCDTLDISQMPTAELHPSTVSRTVSSIIYRVVRYTMRLFKVRIVLPPIYTLFFFPQTVVGDFKVFTDYFSGIR